MVYATLRALGIASWAGCVLTLAFQVLTWVFTAAWPKLTVMDIMDDLFGLDMNALLANLPLQVAVKTIYVFMTTELSLGLWCLGAFFFVSAFTYRVLLKR